MVHLRALRMFIIALATVGASMVVAGTPLANAQTSSDSPVISVTASSVGSFKFSLHGMILEDVKLKGTKAGSSQCHWVASGWNSGRGVDGHLHWFRDHHMWVCPNRHSPTGWVKVKGGMTGRNCGNPVAFKRPKHVVKVVTLVKSFAKIHIVVKAMASASVTGSCPNSNISGSASSSGVVSATITESTIVQAKGSASAVKVIVSQNLKASGIASATAKLTLTCPAPPPPPPPPPGKAHAWLSKTAIKDGAGVTLSGGEFTFSVTVNGTPTSSTTNAATGQSRDLGQFNPGDSVTVCETNTGGYTPDQVCISHTMAADENFTFSFVNRKNSPPPPTPPSITITSFTNLNQVPAGDNSGPAPFTVNASDAGGIVTVSPDLGGISACNSSTPQGSITFNLAAGNNNECVIYYAPNDSDQPPSDTITYTATVTTAGGTAKDVKTDTVDITYPVRP